MNNLLNKTKETSKYWWISLLVGIFAIVLGIWCIMVPLTTLIALAYVFIVTFFVSGFFDIIHATSMRKIHKGWGWTLAGGIIDVLFSLLLIVMPLPIITELIVYLVGFWILFRSIWAVGIALDLRTDASNTWLLVLAVLGIVFSFVFLLSPIFDGFLVVLLLSFALIFYGVFRINYGLRLKKMKGTIDDNIENNID